MERCENGSAKSEGGADRWRLLPALEVLRVPPPRPPSRPRLPIDAVGGVGACATGKAGLVLEPPTAIPAQATPACAQRASAVAGQAGTAARTADAEDEGRAHDERQRASDLWVPPEPCVGGRGQALKTLEIRRGVGQQPLQARAQHLLQALGPRVGNLLEVGLVDVVSRQAARAIIKPRAHAQPKEDPVLERLAAAANAHGSAAAAERARRAERDARVAASLRKTRRHICFASPNCVRLLT